MKMFHLTARRAQALIGTASPSSGDTSLSNKSDADLSAEGKVFPGPFTA
jgi:hypothetical protein